MRFEDNKENCGRSQACSHINQLNEVFDWISIACAACGLFRRTKQCRLIASRGW